jgi:uncharacterized protein (TIGR03492 family)
VGGFRLQLLCLSNGHGEDIIAVRILQELQQQPNPPKLAALPLVGEGEAYSGLGIPIIGPMQRMPSGGFIYMDGRQLLRDVKGGLLQLTLAQFKAVRSWAKKGGVVLAVGDIVPLLFAWLSGADYAFVGTAKSEYYLRDEAGVLPRKSWAERQEGWAGSVYLPWERWLMSRSRCKGVFPRDRLTTETLQQWSIPALDLGNPMMDGILPEHPDPIFYERDAETKEVQRSLIFTLLPGSRPPEAYANWEKILLAVDGVIAAFTRRSIVLLGAIAPSLSLDSFRQILSSQGWSLDVNATSELIRDPAASIFTKANATLILTQTAYNDCLLNADFAIAMAGTATEQFVGLGKPAIAIPGKGPQYTPAFAEAQSRLLGPSLIVAEQPAEVVSVVQQLLRDPDRLQLIVENGLRRMGEPGSSRRIATCLMERLGNPV